MTPMNLPALALAAASLLLTIPAIVLLKRATLGLARAGERCFNCRYQLRGVPRDAPACPECGAPIVTPGARPPQLRSQRLARLACAAALCLPLATAVFVLYQVAYERGLLDGYFPEAGRMRALEGNTLGRIPGVVGICDDFAAGRASPRLLRAAVNAIFRNQSLSTEPSADNQFAAGIILASMDGPAAKSIESLLHNPALSERRRDTLVDILADAYRRYPLTHVSEIDSALCRAVAPEKPLYGEEDRSDPPPVKLTDRQLRVIIDAFMDVFDTPGRCWSPDWCTFIEAAHAAGRIDDAAIEAYLRAAFRPRLVVHESGAARAGDTISFSIEPHLRLGSSMPVHVRITGVTGLSADRVISPARSGVVRHGLVEPARIDGLLALPDRAGVLDVEIEVTATFGARTAKMDRMKPPLPALRAAWSKLPHVSVARKLQVRVNLLPSDAPRPQMGPVKVSLAPDMRCQLHARGEGRAVEARLELKLGDLPCDGAFDVLLVQGSREWKLGWLYALAPNRASGTFTAPAPGFRPEADATILIRPALGPLERPIWSPVLWGSELRYDPVRVSPEPWPEEP